NVQTAGKTGTAQNETGIDHSWFIGFAPADDPQVAVAIIIENTGGGTRATQLAGRIFDLAIE
ncbi:MAG: penicillin-binding transpeptidase domain-containing protein, partial [Defluviitaleaceae bacterium]|nr:penicillin-binding transpeptidase domain-containing protein [Defluviitaleaceae bacterium]